MYPLIDWLLALPTVFLALIVAAFWGGVAYAVHRVAVPRICGPDGRRLGKFEAEVTSQIALSFGLLISFNAVWIWDRGDRVRGAVLDEASALQSVLDVAQASEVLVDVAAIPDRVQKYARHLIDVEWPTLSDAKASRTRPTEFTALRREVAQWPDAELLAAVDRAGDARDLRLREGLVYMSPLRWIVVVMLGVLLLLSIGALHGEAPRGRILALSLVSVAIATCFLVLVAHGRPFVGSFAIKPTELERVVERIESERAARR